MKYRIVEGIDRKGNQWFRPERKIFLFWMPWCTPGIFSTDILCDSLEDAQYFIDLKHRERVHPYVPHAHPQCTSSISGTSYESSPHDDLR